MHQAMTIFASLAILMAAGCGGSNPAPAPPAPAYQPPTAVSDEQTPKTDPADVAETEPSTTGESDRTASSLTARPSTVEDEPAETEIADQPEPPSAAPAAGDNSADATATAGENQPGAAAGGNRTGKSKLLRGLARSFARAVPKALSGARSGRGDNRDKPSPADQRPATPDLKDDPHPNGEPVDEPAGDNQ